MLGVVLACAGVSQAVTGVDGGPDAPPSSGRWVLHNTTPARDWTHAFPTGNGRLGTLVRGGIGRDVITCVHEELFIREWDRRVEAVADLADWLPDVRRAVDGEPVPGRTVAHAVGEAHRQLVEKGAGHRWTLMPHPAFDLVLDVARQGEGRAYRRQLDLETGEALTVWSDDEGGVETRVFSSRPDHVNVVRVKASDGRRLNLDLYLRETPGRDQPPTGHARVPFDVAGAFRAVRAEATERGLYYYADYAKDRGGYEGVARVEVRGGTRRVEQDRIRIEDAEELLVLLRIDFLDDAAAARRVEVERELAALPSDYDALLARHAAGHGEMFRRVVLDLGQAGHWGDQSVEQLIERSVETGVTPLFLEQAFAMGRYLLISSSGRYPPPLQGIWSGEWSANWAGGFVLDSNVNLAISTVSMGDLPECAESYFSFVERQLPGWRANAAAYLGTRGFLVPQYADPETGYLTHFSEGYPWMYWPGGGGWNIRPFYEHGLLTGDDEFMQERVLPLYRELALFYEDYMVAGEDGLFHITPGISPENFTPIGLVAKDTAFDFAVAREVFTVLLELGERFDLPAAELAAWRARRDRLRPYRINADGALAEWIDPRFPDQYAHRHNSHLYGLFPGFELLRTGADPALVTAAREAVERRLAHDTGSGHGLIHLAVMAARIRDRDQVVLQLDRLSRRRYFHAGFVSSHDPNLLVYNLDVVLSLPRVLMETLLFSMPGHIELMPAWHERLGADGSLMGLRAAGGFVVDLEWADGVLRTATIRSTQGGVCTIVHGDRTLRLETQAGGSYTFDHRLDRVTP